MPLQCAAIHYPLSTVGGPPGAVPLPGNLATTATTPSSR